MSPKIFKDFLLFSDKRKKSKIWKIKLCPPCTDTHERCQTCIARSWKLQVSSFALCLAHPAQPLHPSPLPVWWSHRSMWKFLSWQIFRLGSCKEWSSTKNCYRDFKSVFFLVCFWRKVMIPQCCFPKHISLPSLSFPKVHFNYISMMLLVLWKSWDSLSKEDMVPALREFLTQLKK